MAERVLFTCVGTSDPVREMRDGSMLRYHAALQTGKGIHLPIQRDGGLEKADRRLEETFVCQSKKWVGWYGGSGDMNTADFSMFAEYGLRFGRMPRGFRPLTVLEKKLDFLNG